MFLQKGFHPIFYVKDVASPTFAYLVTYLKQISLPSRQNPPLQVVFNSCVAFLSQ